MREFHILILVNTLLVKSRRFDRATVIIRSWERWYLDQGKGVNEADLAGGTLYRCDTIGMKNIALEVWKKIFAEYERDGRHEKL